MKYYYFRATLPMLSMDAEPGLSFEEFRASCEAHLTRADLARLDALTAGAAGPAGHGRFERAWWDAETELRNAVARLRATRLNRDARRHLREQTGLRLWLEHGVTEAFGHRDPLARERALDRLRWTMLEELATREEPFGIVSVLTYALQLRIAERWAGLDSDRGARTVERWVGRERSRKSEVEKRAGTREF